jgi:hypothetical protein
LRRLETQRIRLYDRRRVVRIREEIGPPAKPIGSSLTNRCSRGLYKTGTIVYTVLPSFSRLSELRPVAMTAHPTMSFAPNGSCSCTRFGWRSGIVSQRHCIAEPGLEQAVRKPHR